MALQPQATMIGVFGYSLLGIVVGLISVRYGSLCAACSTLYGAATLLIQINGFPDGWECLAVTGGGTFFGMIVGFIAALIAGKESK